MSQFLSPGRTFGEVTLNLCFPCQGIWFDPFESEQLAPSGIINLFKIIHDHSSDLRRPQTGTLHCPRCKDPLMASMDIAKGGRFTYHRCLQNHGRFTVFSQFMIEKGFVRQLAPAEVKALAARIGTIHCTGCGAPVDISTQDACPHCGAPIAILDPEAVNKALANYREAADHHFKPAPEELADALINAERKRAQRSSVLISLSSPYSTNHETAETIGDMILSGIGMALDFFDR